MRTRTSRAVIGAALILTAAVGTVDAQEVAPSVVRLRIDRRAGGVLCSEHEDLHYRVELDATRRTATWQSVRCAAAASRETYCLVRTGTAYPFGRLSGELARLRFRRLRRRYEPTLAMTHAGSLVTTATWADGSAHTVETEGRAGPREVWVAQQLFLGELADTTWEAEHRTPKCDFER